jgi:hypothetical protein
LGGLGRNLPESLSSYLDLKMMLLSLNDFEKNIVSNKKHIFSVSKLYKSET